MKNFLVWLLVLIVLILIEGSLPKTERAWLKIDALFTVLWCITGFVWGLRGLYRFMTK